MSESLPGVDLPSLDQLPIRIVSGVAQLYRNLFGCRSILTGVLFIALSACGDSGVRVGNTNSELLAPVSDASTLPLTPHNDAFRSARYSGAAECSTCHNNLSDEAGNDVSIVDDWSASLMANSARDPYWIAKVAYELELNPTISGELNQTCSVCHVPMASDASTKDAQPQSILGPDGVLSATNPYHDRAMDGVSCTLCHQVEDDGKLGTPEGTSGNFSVAEVASRSERPAYGQYSDPVGAVMQAQAQFNPQLGAHLSTSASCGACHDLRTPVVDAQGSFVDGEGAAFFPEQMIFTEWRNSAYAVPGSAEEQRCQDCHMPQVPGAVQLATRGGGVPRENFARHTFVGANTVMQAMLRDNRQELGILVPAESFDRAIERSRAFMQSSASVSIRSLTREADELVATLDITHGSGHKLPSGFISRRVFVHFVVRNAQGQILFESGRLNDDGSIVGVDSDLDPMAVESHYDVITSPEQVQVYEAVMNDNSGGVTHSLVRAIDYRKDNRLLPVGLDKASAPTEIAVAGAATTDIDFDAGGDSLQYRVALPDNGEYSVTAELIYQPLAYGHLLDLFRSSQSPEVQSFKAFHEAADLKAEVLGVANALLP